MPHDSVAPCGTNMFHAAYRRYRQIPVASFRYAPVESVERCPEVADRTAATRRYIMETNSMTPNIIILESRERPRTELNIRLDRLRPRQFTSVIRSDFVGNCVSSRPDGLLKRAALPESHKPRPLPPLVAVFKAGSRFGVFAAGYRFACDNVNPNNKPVIRPPKWAALSIPL